MQGNTPSADPATAMAIVVLAVLCGALVVWVVTARRATPYPWWQFGLHLVNSFFARIMWRGEVVGTLDLPAGQGAVIVCNHASGIDPLLIQLCTLRIVHWMVAREYYMMPFFSILFRNMGSIPVNRGGIDTAATKMAIRYAQEGGLVGLFPEGRVNVTDALLLPGRLGAALIALRAGVPVVPCYVQGAPYDGTALGSFFMTAKARVTIGKPIDLSAYAARENDKTALQELTILFLREIARLAGDEDFEPELAGRQWKPGSDDASGNGHIETVAARGTNGARHE